MKKNNACFIVLAYLLIINPLIAQPSDKYATKETRNLMLNLKKLLNKGVMFGHQDALAYGVGWKYEAGRSDIKDVTGEYPALYGWDYSGLEKKDGLVNIDGVPFKKMRDRILNKEDCRAKHE